MSIQSITNNVTITTATSSSQGNDESLVQFSQVLANAITSHQEVDNRSAEFVSGRFGIDLRNGIPSRVSYFDENGHTLNTSTFSAKNILKNAEKYSISLADLEGLGTQLDNAGIGYRPYELYPGTGSDHGVNFQDLIEGGLGTAYDWRQDSNAALKDTYLVGTAVEGQASRFVQEAQEFADRIGVVKNSEVTREQGINPSKFTTLVGGDGKEKSFVNYNGGIASWHETQEEAENAKNVYSGVVIDIKANIQELAVSKSPTATLAQETTNTATNSMLEELLRLI